jgi:UDP-N-acetylmuramate--alanine ligase
LIACIFENAGLDPTVINGGIINSIGANAKLGDGKFIIAEADESDGSFTLLPSTIGVINNIDLEHLDFYKSIDEIKKVFIKYAEKIPFYGFLCVCNDDKNTKSIIKYIKSKPIITFGTSESSNFIAKNIKTLKNSISSFDIYINFKSKKIVKNIKIPLIGKHNVLNALCAFSVCYQLNIPIKKISEGLKKFSGVKRRFSILNKNSKSLIIDDYAHHPSEIKTTLESLKKITRNKVVAIFEPHRYTRINGLLKKFIESFSKADFVFILPIYSAGEKNIKKITNLHLEKMFKKKFKNNKIIKAVENEQNLFKDLKDLYKSENNIIFLGAGSSSNIAQKFSIYIE